MVCGALCAWLCVRWCRLWLGTGVRSLFTFELQPDGVGRLSGSWGLLVSGSGVIQGLGPWEIDDALSTAGWGSGASPELCLRHGAGSETLQDSAQYLESGRPFPPRSTDVFKRLLSLREVFLLGTGT